MSWARMVDPSTLIEASDKVQVKSQIKVIQATLKRAAERKEMIKALPTVDELKSTMPQYSFDETKKSLEDINKVKEDFKNKEVFGVSTSGRKADESLKKSKSGVPLFSTTKKEQYKDKTGKVKYKTVKINKIPRLDIGEEPTISASDLLIPGLIVVEPKYLTPEPLLSPSIVAKDLATEWQKKVAIIPEPKGLKRKDYGVDTVISERSIEKGDMKLSSIREVEIKPIKKFSPDHLKMLSAKILYSKGKNCHAVAGLFNDLSHLGQYREEANFFLGVCAHKMGFYTESVNRLIKVILKEDPFYTTEAIQVITSHLPREYEVDVARTIVNIKNKALLPEGYMDNVNYVLAKGHIQQKKYNQAIQFATQVKTDSDKYPKALFIKGIAQYSTGKELQAIESLKEARSSLKGRSGDYENLHSLISVNLARLNFQVRKFSQANVEYLRVKKDSPFWIQALVEQGWAQLMMNDPSGAIGNMYSLHSPYFQSVYKPESYAVRTIGYLDICQYGDAYQTLNLMEERYRPWIKSVDHYIKTKRNKNDYYNTLKTYLSGKSQSNVDGLPFQVIREMARKRNFLNHQDSINHKVDEFEQYSFIKKLMAQDVRKFKWRIKKAKERIAAINVNLNKAKKDSSLIPKIVEWKAKKNFEINLVRNLTFQIALYGQNIKGFRRLEKVAKNRINAEKSNLKVLASKELIKNLYEAKVQMQKILDNNELLRFEVFSGSGENIRYKVAGGESTDSNRVPASYKPQKSLQWSVIGEYWADEIGKYRSALKNNCPKKARMPKMRSTN